MINIDFETFSAAGFRWKNGRWAPPEGSKKSGLPGIGVEVYAMHPSTRVICLAWGSELWRAGEPIPQGLVERVIGGDMLSAWNSLFEFWIWNRVLVPRGWPVLPLGQIVDSMPRARAWCIPGSLAGAAKVLGLDAQKDKRGGQLIRKFCMPRNPTKLDPRMVILAADDSEEFEDYCRQDVRVETEAAKALPELSDYEMRVWRLDQEINVRGIPVDTVAVDNACEILRQSARVLDVEMQEITGGSVSSATEIAKLTAFIRSYGEDMASLGKEDVVAKLLDPSLPDPVRQALLNRQAVGSMSTKKIWAFKNRTASDGRIYGQFSYHGAATGRWTGYGIQPHNFPRPDAPVSFDGLVYGQVGTPESWSGEATEQFIDHMACRDYCELQQRWGDVLKGMSSSLRGLICAPPGRELIGSDYTAIEAVVLAVIAGEQWRVDLFKARGKLYETSASKITGRTLEEYAAYYEKHGCHHPDRALGKLAELASGFQGSVGAWVKFGAEKFFDEERCEKSRNAWLDRDWYSRDLNLQQFTIQQQVWAWRNASPKIVALWKGLEKAAQFALTKLGVTTCYRDIRYHVEGKVLYCTLPSGCRLAYHNARLQDGNIHYTSVGKIGWMDTDTYGGKLTENVVQAIARGILAQGMLNVDAAGYPIVMHVHDEIISEVPAGWGSIEEFERLMGDLPSWAKGWPVRAAGGWRGKRFRK